MPAVSIPPAKRGGLGKVWMREINLIPESSTNLSGSKGWLPGIKIRNLMSNGQTAGYAGLMFDPK